MKTTKQLLINIINESLYRPTPPLPMRILKYFIVQSNQSNTITVIVVVVRGILVLRVALLDVHVHFVVDVKSLVVAPQWLIAPRCGLGVGLCL